MAGWSMSQRLVISLSAITGLLWLLGVTFTALTIRHEIDEVFDSALQEAAQRILPLAADDVRERTEHEHLSGSLPDVTGTGAHQEYLHYQVRDAAGRVLLHSHDAPETPFSVPLKRGFYDDGTRRYFTELSTDGTLAVQVAELPKERQAAVRALWLGLLVPLLGVLPLAALAIRETVKRTTQPVRDLQRELSARDGANLAALNARDLPEELAPIAGGINRLLNRLSTALEAERAFAANSAHELRNPIAAAHAQATILAQTAEGEAQRKRAVGLVSTLATLSRKIEALLQLARAESGLALSREPVSLAGLVGLLIAEYDRKPQAQGRISFSSPAQGAVIVNADPDALGIAIQNLFENALKHSPSGSPVTVRLGPGAELSVSNDGEAVAPEELANLKMRFRRGAARDPSGSGLGLYIADMIARQAGGSLTLHSPARGRETGFEAVLRL